MQYSAKVIAHFQNPKNNHKMNDADSIGKVYNPYDCGDMVKIYLKSDGEIVKDITFECVGCPAAIASASVFTEMAKGKSVSEVLKITRQDVAAALGGLPENKINCSVISCDAFRKAVKKLEKKSAQGGKGGLLKRLFKK